MGQKKPRGSKSSTRTKHPSEEEPAPLRQQVRAASEEKSPGGKSKGSSEPVEQESGAASGPPERSPSKSFPIVGIGASAGGLEAFTSFLKALRADIGMAFVLVQHMDPTHESFLNRLLAKDTAMPVIQVTDGMAVEPNRVYVIPPNTEMTIHEGRLRLIARPGGETRHTPINSFLSALAEDQQSMAIGVILSGIGTDGTKGLQAIKAEGGITFAQDEESAKFLGMPQSAAAAGCVDLVLPPDKIARELSRMRRHPYLEIVQRPPATAELPPRENGSLRTIFRLMRSATGVDFTHYKQTTIRRRISRRMLVRRCETLAQYVKYVEGHPDEVRALFQDVLIHVTSFFREPEVYQALRSLVFPRVTANLASGETVRIWAPGCSSGEEVYSIAIALHEYFGETATQTGIQIFGTDISDLNIQKARAAIYSEASTEGLSAERLRRFFVKMEGGYQVTKQIREMCVFARHDLIKDPPFSRMDLISCRNVLIYLAPVLQRRVLEFFHYALKPSGFLILGKSESVSAGENLFSLEDQKSNVYCKVQTLTRPLPEFRMTEYERAVEAFPHRPPTALPFDLRKEAERLILDRYAPAGVIVDPDLRLVHFQGDTSPFLKPTPGEASFHLLKLVRPELILEIRAAIQEAKKRGTPAHREGVRFKHDSQMHQTDLEAVPIRGRSTKGADFLVLFPNHLPHISEKRRLAGKSGQAIEAKELERLKQDLASSQDNLRSLLEDQEAASEELRAANEEILSSNEELQSTNEELQTAKEELQSSNEELTTLNEELQNRNVELSRTANDLNSLLNAIEIPIVILGTDLRIRRFTPAAEKLLGLLASDVGRPIAQTRSNLDIPDLDRAASEVIERMVSVEREVQDHNGKWYVLRMRPYQTAENTIEGIVMVLVDIHDLKQYSTAIVETMRGCLLVLDPHLRVLLASPPFYTTFEAEKGETEGRLLPELGDGQWNIPPLLELLEKVLPEKKEVVDFELAHDFPKVGHKIMLLNARQLLEVGMGGPKILLVIEDVTVRSVAEARNRLLLDRLMTAKEEEGKRIALELHDSYGPRLAAAELRVSEVERLVSSQPKLAEKLVQIRNELSAVAKISHDLSHQLHPAALTQLGLGTALEAECASFSKLRDIAVHFSAGSVPEALPDAVATCLYRVAEESLENIRKHAQAKTASVTLAGKDREIVMVIQDFGRGFDLRDGLGRVGGLGFVSMEERVSLVHGSLSVNSKPGEGTRVEVRIPLGAA
jgi:two-component system CheB/CheR fusion protein